MKRITVSFIAAFIVGWALASHAGDEYQANLDLTIGASSACVTGLRPKTQYAVRCTSDTYLRVTDVYDGGTAGIATTKDALVPQDKMFDIPTAANQVAACGIQKSASGTCYFYIFRDTRN